MRTVDEIKKEMVDGYTANETIRSLYGVREGETLTLAKASIENILFYVVAFSIWVLERLFNEHKTEVENYIAEMKPHTRKWYANMAKKYMQGIELVEDADYYDTSNMTDEAIEAAQIVKYAASVESDGVVIIKVAGESNSEPSQISDLSGIEKYIGEIKDAGVIINVRSGSGDHYRATLKIWYDAKVLKGNGESLLTGTKPVEECVKKFLSSLPFNGEYRNDAMIDAIQAVDGVEIAELVSSEQSVSGIDWSNIYGFATPYYGWFKIYNDEDLHIEYIAK
jgi:hypothetical protein